MKTKELMSSLNNREGVERKIVSLAFEKFLYVVVDGVFAARVSLDQRHRLEIHKELPEGVYSVLTEYSGTPLDER